MKKRHKSVRYLMVTLVLLMQITFLTIFVFDKYETNPLAAILLVSMMPLIILFGLGYLDLHHAKPSYERISVAIWVPFGALFCYFLNVSLDFGSVISAGATGTLASFIPMLKKESKYLPKLPIAIYCGAFVGMSSAEIIPTYGFVALAGTLTGLFFILTKNMFLGMGGKLGTIAFGGVILVSLIFWITK